MEGNLRFKIDWTSLIAGRKFTVFALFYVVFEGNFQVQSPGGLYLEGRFNGGFFTLRVGGLIFGGAYFRNFTVFVYFETIKWILKLLTDILGEQDCMCYITALKYSS